jgi:hypothetical protein
MVAFISSTNVIKKEDAMSIRLHAPSCSVADSDRSEKAQETKASADK